MSTFFRYFPMVAPREKIWDWPCFLVSGEGGNRGAAMGNRYCPQTSAESSGTLWGMSPQPLKSQSGSVSKRMAALRG